MDKAMKKAQCKFYASGKCKYGRKCRFLHDDCQAFSAGLVCPWVKEGKECPFGHIYPPKKDFQCRRYASGRCTSGKECPFRHNNCQAFSAGLDCPFGYDCKFGHMEKIPLHVGLIGTFGWRNVPDEKLVPLETAPSKELLHHFHERIEFPGRPRILNIKTPIWLPEEKLGPETECMRFARSPVPAALMVATRCGFDWMNEVQFVTARRNLIGWTDRKKRLIHVQRHPNGPIFLRAGPGKSPSGMIGEAYADAMTESKESKEPSSDQFRTVLRVSFGNYRLMMTGEVDSVTPDFFNVTEENKFGMNAKLLHVREIKSTQKALDDKTKCFMSIASMFLQSSFVGTPTIVVGKRDKLDGKELLTTTTVHTQMLLEPNFQVVLLKRVLDILDRIELFTPPNGQMYCFDTELGVLSEAPKDTPDIVRADMFDLILSGAKSPHELEKAMDKLNLL